MKAAHPLRVVLASMMLFVTALFMFACGGGSSGSSEQSGQVTLLLTDAPTDDFSEVNVTIHGISLLGDEAETSLFNSRDGEEVNLLDLQSESMLFSISDNVPAGWYNKIRLSISRVELVKKDDPHNPILANILGNGKIDLNPRQPFFVAAGQTLVLQLDMDAAKSIHVTETGNKMKYQFRPVVFVDVLSEGFPAKLVRISGTVQDILDDSFILCPENCGKEDLSEDSDDKASCCGILVHVTDDTSIFDNEGDLAALKDLQEGSEVQAIGKFRTEGSSTAQSDDACRAEFDAFVVEIGTFLSLDGTITSEVQQNEQDAAFLFEIDPGQGIIGDLEIEILLSEGTKVFSSQGQLLDISALGPGKEARVDAILVRSEDGDFLKAALVIVKDSDTDVKIEGTIDKIGDDFLIIIQDDGQLVRACFSKGTNVYRITVDDCELEIEPTEAEELKEGNRVELFGHQGEDCFDIEDLFLLSSP